MDEGEDHSTDTRDDASPKETKETQEKGTNTDEKVRAMMTSNAHSFETKIFVSQTKKRSHENGHEHGTERGGWTAPRKRINNITGKGQDLEEPKGLLRPRTARLGDDGRRRWRLPIQGVQSRRQAEPHHEDMGHETNPGNSEVRRESRREYQEHQEEILEPPGISQDHHHARTRMAIASEPYLGRKDPKDNPSDTSRDLSHPQEGWPTQVTQDRFRTFVHSITD